MIEHHFPLVTHHYIGSSSSPGSFPVPFIPSSWNHIPNKPPACKSLSQSLFSGKLMINIMYMEVRSER